MADLLIPVGVRVPMRLRRRVSGVATEGDVSDLAYRLGGRGVKPRRHILLYGPDARTPAVVIADGETEAAELEDLAVATLERQRDRVARSGRALDFDALREKHQQMRREDVDAAVRQAMRDRASRHLANPVTDPPVQPQYPDPKDESWKREINE